MQKFLKLLSLIMATSSIANAQSEGNMRDIIRINDKSYMVVFPFESQFQYSEFSNNKKILADSHKEMLELKLKVEASRDESQKEIMASELMRKTETFKTNDDTMRKNYNYTIGRQYVELFLKTYICTPISDEEFSVLKFNDSTPIDPLKIVKNGNERFYRKYEISGFQANQDFQGVLAFIMDRRAQSAKLRSLLAEEVDMQKVTEITDKISDMEKALKEKIQLLKDKYHLESDSKYMIEIDKARLLILLTPEEIVQMQAQQQVKN